MWTTGVQGFDTLLNFSRFFTSLNLGGGFASAQAAFMVVSLVWKATASCRWFVHLFIQRIDLREKNTGNSHISEENRWFPVDVPFRQSIDSYLLDRGYYIYIYVCVTYQSIAVLVSIMSGFTMGLRTSTNGGGKTKQHLFYIHLYIYTFIHHIYIMYIIISYHIVSLEHMLQTWYILTSSSSFQQLSPSNLPTYHHIISPMRLDPHSLYPHKTAV